MTINSLLLALLIIFLPFSITLVQHFPRLAASHLSSQPNSDAVGAAQSRYRPLVHGVHPGSADGDEQSVDDIGLYTQAVGKKVAFVYFSQELNKKWLEADPNNTNILFPKAKIDEIRGHGAVPFIRLMTRSTDKTNKGENLEKLYSYDVLLGEPGLKGDELKNSKRFRDRMVAWGVQAAKLPFPVYVEWGTEVNGEWFWWNGKWYAQRVCKKNRRRDESEEACVQRVLPQAPLKFREVFSHLRRLVNNEAKAANVRWIYHVTANGEPEPKMGGENNWNAIAKYYPEGSVDAIGLSVYGAQDKSESCADEKHSFASQMNLVMEGAGRPDEDTLKSIAGTTPIYVLEFGETLLVPGSDDPNSHCNAAKWAREALATMFHPSKWAGYNLAGFSWWTEAWVDDEKGIIDMRVHEFQLCDLEDKNDKKVHGMRCDCWRGANTGCDNLSRKRSDLREVFRNSLNEPGKLLITSAPDSPSP